MLFSGPLGFSQCKEFSWLHLRSAPLLVRSVAKKARSKSLPLLFGELLWSWGTAPGAHLCCQGATKAGTGQGAGSRAGWYHRHTQWPHQHRAGMDISRSRARNRVRHSPTTIPWACSDGAGPIWSWEAHPVVPGQGWSRGGTRASQMMQCSTGGSQWSSPSLRVVPKGKRWPAPPLSFLQHSSYQWGSWAWPLTAQLLTFPAKPLEGAVAQAWQLTFLVPRISCLSLLLAGDSMGEKQRKIAEDRQNLGLLQQGLKATCQLREASSQPSESQSVLCDHRFQILF